jgi:hypothetical protein
VDSINTWRTISSAFALSSPSQARDHGQLKRRQRRPGAGRRLLHGNRRTFADEVCHWQRDARTVDLCSAAKLQRQHAAKQISASRHWDQRAKKRFRNVRKRGRVGDRQRRMMLKHCPDISGQVFALPKHI